VSRLNPTLESQAPASTWPATRDSVRPSASAGVPPHHACALTMQRGGRVSRRRHERPPHLYRAHARDRPGSRVPLPIALIMAMGPGAAARRSQTPTILYRALSRAREGSPGLGLAQPVI
jgi:hypothetical protein